MGRSIKPSLKRPLNTLLSLPMSFSPEKPAPNIDKEPVESKPDTSATKEGESSENKDNTEAQHQEQLRKELNQFSAEIDEKMPEVLPGVEAEILGKLGTLWEILPRGVKLKKKDIFPYIEEAKFDNFWPKRQEDLARVITQKELNRKKKYEFIHETRKVLADYIFFEARNRAYAQHRTESENERESEREDKKKLAVSDQQQIEQIRNDLGLPASRESKGNKTDSVV